jgi:hypothetical protein
MAGWTMRSAVASQASAMRVEWAKVMDSGTE